MPSYKPKNWYKQQINIAKNQLNFDEDQYRQTLEQLTKKNSLCDMTIPDLVKVLEHMKKAGFKHKKANSKAKSPKSRNKTAGEKTMLDKLRQIWIEMHYQGFINEGSEQSLLKWASSQVKRINKGQAVAKLEWFNGQMLYFAIEQLKQWHLRLLKQAIKPEQQKCFDLHLNKQLDNFETESFLTAIEFLNRSEGHAAYNNAFNVFKQLNTQHHGVSSK